MIVEKVNYTDKDLLTFLGQQESQDVYWGNHFKDGLINRFENGEQFTGSELPWSKTSQQIRLRPGEVTIWAGMNGHFKSMLLGQVLQWIAMKEDAPVGVMSFEMPIVDTMHRMVMQAAGSKNPPTAFIDRWATWNNKRIAYYDKLDTTRSDRVLGVVFHMAKDLGCKHIMIDSLTKCGLPYGERGSEKEFIDALCSTAKVFGIHIHLVCHVRKPQAGGEEYKPTKFDVRGAGELTDLVHNVIICWADKKRKKLAASSFALKDSEKKYLDDNPDQRLIVAKQRGGQYEGTIGLYLHPSLQFTSQEGRAMPFNFQHEDIAASQEISA